MKRIFTFLLIVFACIVTASAERITEQQALQKAQLFMRGKQLAVPNAARGKSFQTKDTIPHGYYVFNTVESNGFVIIASDDRMPEVLGYSERGSLDPKTAPCNVKWLLAYYDKVAANIREVGAKARAARRSSKPDIRPMVTTTWDQGAPYNDQCPENNGARCITGCVATAMAQVINYNRWPVGQTNGVPAYITGSAQISVPALEPTSFDWDNMTNDDIARLMRYCGQSVKMDYNVNESGAMPPDEAPALIKIFGYSQTAHYAEHEYYSDEEWEDLLYNELAEQRPIVYNGWGTGGGHTFVVHGYRDGRFYINWGWSGNEDGYFLLTGLNTGIGDFNNTQSATIGIQPPAGADVNRPKVVIKQIGYFGEKYFFRNETNEFSFGVYGTLVSDLAEQKSFIVGLGLYDAEGLKKVLWEEQHDFPVGEDYEFNTNLIIGNDIPDGEYRLVPISRDDVNDTWRTDANASDYYLTVTISGKYMKVLTYPLSSEERSITDLGVQTIDGITYNLYIQNNKNRASLLASENGSFQGDVNIPDMVNYQGTDYRVYTAAYTVFQNCNDLISLSVGMPNIPTIWGCNKLNKLELREGVIKCDQIGGCGQLESIEFPKSLSVIQNGVSWCQNLKTIRFKNSSQFIFENYPDWSDNSLPNLTDVYFSSADAPLVRWKDGDRKPHSTATIHVPQGYKAEYEASDWNGWKIVEDLPVPDAEGIEWGYCEGNTVTGNGPYDTVGGNDGEYAIHVPAAMIEAYKGKTISSIQVYQSMAYDYVFITKPGTDYLVKQPVEGVENSWIDVPLTEPYTITGDELFVGVGHKGNIGMLFADENAIEKDGLWFRAMGTDNSTYEPGEWICIPEQAPNYAHPIPVRFIISGSDIPEDALLKEVTLNANSKTSYSLSAKVVNRSLKKLEKVTLEWNFDGTNKGSKTIDVDIRPTRSQAISLDIDATLEGRNHDFNYTLTKVNDATDGVKANSTGTVNFNTSANTYYPRRVVMEEATGTWCGWCVRGIETIERLKNQYPDNFIAIGLHSGDEMANLVNYGSITKKFNTYPSCLINRMTLMNPAWPLVQPIVEEMKDKAEAKVAATAIYAKRDYSAVIVNTESVFGFSDDKTSNFRLSYALVEDYIGPYVQNNYYSGIDMDADFMGEWIKKEAKVKMEFNDVARGLFGGPDGVEGSVPKTLKEGETYKYAYTFPLPNNISKRENLRIVVMLIDNNSGEIINACQTAIAYDQTIENQTFSLYNNGNSLLDGDVVTYSAQIDPYEGKVGDCGTNVEEDKEGLMLKTYDAKTVNGTAKLEILSNTIDPGQLTWTMGGSVESILGKTVAEKEFSTDSNGKVAIGLKASNMRGYGQLEARLTITIGTQSETAKIVFLNEKPVVVDISPKSNEVWWCNHDTRDVESGGLGTSMAERYHAAIFIPFNMLAGAGTTIDAFSFEGKNAMGNVTVWISTKLPNEEKDADLEIISIPDNQIRPWSMWNSVAFSQSHEIPEEGLYVGYSFDITDPNLPGGKFPLMYSISDLNRKGGMWIKSDSNPKWTDMGLKYGNLSAKVLFGGDSFVRNAVSIKDSKASVFTLLGGSVSTSQVFVNEGADIVEQLTIEIKGNKGSTETADINIHIEPYSESIASLTLKADEEAGDDKKTITVIKVNGMDNHLSGSTFGTVRLFTLTEKPTFKPVIESTSATWAWGGIRTPFVFKELDKTFGNKIISIAPHMEDVMSTPDYAEMAETLGIMRTYINRGDVLDSYYGSTWEQWGIKMDIAQALENLAPASISVSAEWKDDDKYKLDISTETQFNLSFSDNPFQIGYVLIEDGLHGTGSRWEQANQYAGDTSVASEPFFSEMVSLPAWVSGLTFDHIPVAAWGVQYGIEGTLPENIMASEKNPYVYSVDIFDNTIIQNKENLSIVALLIDKNTGAIVNAAQYYLGEGSHEDPETQEAKVFEFRYENKSLENNAVVEINAKEDEFGFGEMECLTNPGANPQNGLVLATKDGKSSSGIATITIIQNSLNAKMIQWCMGGECVPMNDKATLTKRFVTDDNGICLVMFDATDIKSEGTLEAKLTATLGGESWTVNIKFVYDKTNGINIIYSDDDNAVWYDMKGNRLENAPNRKGVYIRSGKKVVK